MKHFMCTHTFHSKETKIIFFKAHFGEKSGTGLVRQIIKIVLNVFQHGSENMTPSFVTGQLRVKI